MDKFQTLHEKDNPSNNVYPNIQSTNIPSDAVTTAKIADDAVTTDKIADDAITTAKILDMAVTEEKIADDAVTTDKIDTGAVTSDKIASNAVTYGKIKKTHVNLQTYITAGDWSDERYFADAIESVLIKGGRYLLKYNDYTSEVIVSASPFNGITLFKFVKDNQTPLPTSALIDNDGLVKLTDASELSTFYSDFGAYVYIWQVADN